MWLIFVKNWLPNAECKIEQSTLKLKQVEQSRVHFLLRLLPKDEEKRKEKCCMSSFFSQVPQSTSCGEEGVRRWSEAKGLHCWTFIHVEEMSGMGKTLPAPTPDISISIPLSFQIHIQRQLSSPTALVTLELCITFDLTFLMWMKLNVILSLFFYKILLLFIHSPILLPLTYDGPLAPFNRFVQSVSVLCFWFASSRTVHKSVLFWIRYKLAFKRLSVPSPVIFFYNILQHVRGAVERWCFGNTPCPLLLLLCPGWRLCLKNIPLTLHSLKFPIQLSSLPDCCLSTLVNISAIVLKNHYFIILKLFIFWFCLSD